MSDTKSALDDAVCANCGHLYLAHFVDLGLCDECPDEECECKFAAVRYAGGAYTPDAERAEYEKAMKNA